MHKKFRLVQKMPRNHERLHKILKALEFTRRSYRSTVAHDPENPNMQATHTPQQSRELIYLEYVRIRFFLKKVYK